MLWRGNEIVPWFSVTSGSKHCYQRTFPSLETDFRVFCSFWFYLEIPYMICDIIIIDQEININRISSVLRCCLVCMYVYVRHIVYQCLVLAWTSQYAAMATCKVCGWPVGLTTVCLLKQLNKPALPRLRYFPPPVMSAKSRSAYQYKSIRTRPGAFRNYRSCRSANVPSQKASKIIFILFPSLF